MAQQSSWNEPRLLMADEEGDKMTVAEPLLHYFSNY